MSYIFPYISTLCIWFVISGYKQAELQNNSQLINYQ